jgi:catechol 2,3-dioxygenase-like lactoylglutathione lyase family enzyme
MRRQSLPRAARLGLGGMMSLSPVDDAAEHQLPRPAGKRGVADRRRQRQRGRQRRGDGRPCREPPTRSAHQLKGRDRRGSQEKEAVMTIQRMDNVLIVVEDLETAKAFFGELGMELEGETEVEGPWVDSVVGLDGVRADIAMLRTPDGHGRVELTRFHTPPAVRAEPENAPANALGLRRIMFTVDDLDDVVARLRTHGAELLREIAQYEDLYRLCFMRGPEGIIIGLAEQLSQEG